jgi:hypothetical protein
MSPDASSFSLSNFFRRVHSDKNSRSEKPRRKHDDGAQEGVVTLSIASGTSSKAIVGTSMTDGAVSQPAHPAHVASVEPGSHEQVPSSVAQSASSAQQIATMDSAALPSPPAPIAPTASQKHPSSTVLPSTPSTLPERLWDRAYDDLKADESTLIKAYERCLSRELYENVSSSMASELHEGSIEQTNLTMRRSQMSQLIRKGVGEAMQVVLSAKDIIGSAVQTVPQAALAWAGVCFALQVSFVRRNCNYKC